MGLFSGTQGGQMMMVGPVMPQTQALLPPPEIVNLSNVRQRQGQYGTQVSKQKESMSGVKVKALPNEQALLEVEEYKLRNKKAEIDNLAYQYFIGPMDGNVDLLREDTTVQKMYATYYDERMKLERNKIVAEENKRRNKDDYDLAVKNKALEDVGAITKTGDRILIGDIINRKSLGYNKFDEEGKLGLYQPTETIARGVYDEAVKGMLAESGKITTMFTKKDKDGNIISTKVTEDVLVKKANEVYGLLQSYNPQALEQAKDRYYKFQQGIDKSVKWTDTKGKKHSYGIDKQSFKVWLTNDIAKRANLSTDVSYKPEEDTTADAFNKAIKDLSGKQNPAVQLMMGDPSLVSDKDDKMAISKGVGKVMGLRHAPVSEDYFIKSSIQNKSITNFKTVTFGNTEATTIDAAYSVDPKIVNMTHILYDFDNNGKPKKLYALVYVAFDKDDIKKIPAKTLQDGKMVELEDGYEDLPKEYEESQIISFEKYYTANSKVMRNTFPLNESHENYLKRYKDLRIVPMVVADIGRYLQTDAYAMEGATLNQARAEILIQKRNREKGSSGTNVIVENY